MTNLEIDELSRNRIVNETDMNFFVEAGAGSGKTSMLVNRMVAMVEQGKDISSICAITFTKAAAGEFYERFQKELINRSNPDYKYVEHGYAGELKQPTNETMQRCKTALENIDLCFMGTIDSFCNMILSEHPFEAGIPSDSTLISEDEAMVYYKQQYVDICDGLYGTEMASYAKHFRNVHRKPEEVFVKAINIFMNNRNVDFKYVPETPVDIDDKYSTVKTEILGLIDYLLKNENIGYVGNKSVREAWNNLRNARRNIMRNWNNNFSGVVNSLRRIENIQIKEFGYNRNDFTYKNYFTVNQRYNSLYKLNIGAAGGILSKLTEYQYSISMMFFSKCVYHFEKKMKSKGYMTYFDYLFYLRNMLRKDAGDNGKLIEYISRKHKYYLIDEFQDTNPMQAEVFFYLTGIKPEYIWNQNIPRKGSLFIVGDPKQSIYRFRNADVSQFINVRTLFENKNDGRDVLYLHCNFRSDNVLLKYYNNVFSNLFPEKTEDQSKFEDIYVDETCPNESKELFNGIYKYKTYTGQAGKSNPSMEDPVRICDIVKRIVNNDNFHIIGKSETNPRKIKYRDIMIITSSKSKLGPIMDCLNSNDIPTHVEGKVPFESNLALHEIYRLYSVVADMDDASVIYNALTGRLIGLKRRDIVKYKAEGGLISIKDTIIDGMDETKKQMYPPEYQNVIIALKQLYSLYLKGSIMSPAALFQYIMDKFEIFRYIDTYNLEVVYYTLELLRKAEKSGIITSIETGRDYLSILLSGETDEERCLSLDDKKDAVCIANLHKVKGLEAPIVILAYASDKDFPASMHIERRDNQCDGYIFKMESEMDEKFRSYVYLSTAKYNDKKEKENGSLAAEDKRLVYVGATRARNALILCDSYFLDRNDNDVPYSKWKSLLAWCSNDFYDIFENYGYGQIMEQHTIDAAELYKKAVEECAFKTRKSEAVSYAIENPSHTASSKLSDIQTVSNTGIAANSELHSKKIPGKSYSVVHRFPDVLGTMVHRLMELMVKSRDKCNISEVIRDILKEYLTLQTKEYEKEFEVALLKVADTIHKGGFAQNNGVENDILSKLLQADKVFCEVPFAFKDNDDKDHTVWNGIMDVIYLYNGKWHIIDYKTNIDAKDLDKKYENQLKAYIKAFRLTTGIDADAYIYHIDV